MDYRFIIEGIIIGSILLLLMGLIYVSDKLCSGEDRLSFGTDDYTVNEYNTCHIGR